VGFVVILVSSFILIMGESGDIFAENLTYPGTALKPDADGNQALYPTTSYSDNTVTVQGNSTIEVAYGGYRRETGNGTFNIENNTLTVKESSTLERNGYGADMRIETPYHDGSLFAVAKGNKLSVEGQSKIGPSASGARVVIDCGFGDDSFCANAIVTSNELHVTESEILQEAYGAQIHKGGRGASELNSHSNKVTVTNSRMLHEVYGTEVTVNLGEVTAEYNSLTFINSTIGNSGQRAAAADVSIREKGKATISNNSVNFIESVAYYNVYSGHIDTPARADFTAIGNTFKMDNSNFTESVYAFHGDSWLSRSGEARNNWVYAQNGNTVGGQVIAAEVIVYQEEPAISISSENGLKLSDTTVGSNAAGGLAVVRKAGDAVASGNTVALNRTSVGGYVLGGSARTSLDGNATASENIVILPDVSVAGSVTGGKAEVSGSGTAEALNNIIQGSNAGTGLTAVIGGEARAGAGTAKASARISLPDASAATVTGGLAVVNGAGLAEASGSTILRSGGHLTGSAIGGDARAGSGTARASQNALTFTNATLGAEVFGGRALSAGTGLAESGGNMLEFYGTSAADSIIAGYARVDADGTAKADGNAILLSDTLAKGDVIAGYAGVAGIPGVVSATGGQVTLSGNTSLTGEPASCSPCSLAGGETAAPGPDVDVFTGNTLNVSKPASGGIIVAVATVKNFENYNFLFAAGTASGATAIKFTGPGAVVLSDGVSKPSVIRSVDIEEGSSVPGPGARLILVDGPIKTSDGSGQDIFQQTSVSGQMGRYVDLEYDLEYQDGGSLVAVVRDAQATPQSKSLTEAFLAGAVLINQGADLAAGAGLSQAVQGADKMTGWATYSAFDMGHSRHETGSHVDTDSWAIHLGFSKGFVLGSSRLSLGVFVEAGRASYETFNTYPGIGDTRGKGHGEFLGGGMLAHLLLPPSGPGNFYVEASVRWGRASNDFSSEDTGQLLGSYEIASKYWGFHLGAGYDLAISDWGRLDMGVKYFQNRRGGTDAVTPSGTPVSFERVESRRIMASARLSFLASGMVNPYIGVAWEKEFAGEARGSVWLLAIPESPSLKGDTAIGELGLSVRVPSRLPMSIDVGLRGYTGKRKGFSGGIRLNIEF
jgi:hypothetical protein